MPINRFQAGNGRYAGCPEKTEGDETTLRIQLNRRAPQPGQPCLRSDRGAAVGPLCARGIFAAGLAE
jgi:hypothetical protein